MRIVVHIEWDGVTRKQYEQVRDLVNWEGDWPKGGVLHIAAFHEKGFRVTEIWESTDDFQRFARERVMSRVKQIGITDQPAVAIHTLHELFTRKFIAG
jgi:hypothetical protein